MKWFIYSLILATSTAHATLGYDEIYDSQGQIRKPYQVFAKSTLEPKKTAVQKYLDWSRREFEGDNALDPIPRILSGQEYDQELKVGVHQRARALQAFLKDHYSGDKKYLKHQVIPEDVLKRIIGRSYELQFDGLVKPDQISFLYGPDIIRDSAGQWRVIEDNPGFIGGVGDLRLAFDLTMKTYPDRLQSNSFRSPELFYSEVIQNYKKKATAFGGKAVLLMTSPMSDNEDKRIRKIFADYGVDLVTPHTKKQLVVTENGVFTQMYSGGPREKVGHITFLGEHWWLEPSHPATEIQVIGHDIQKNLGETGLSENTRRDLENLLSLIQESPEYVHIEEALRVLETHNIPTQFFQYKRQMKMTQNLLKSALKNQVSLNYSPGVDFIGDKEFYVYVEDLIRFYLNEEPIIKNIETHKFARKNGQLNQTLVDQVFANLDHYVIKRVDGRGGDSVWVGPKLSKKDQTEVQKMIQENPDMYIAQRFTPLSTMGDNIVDLRVITDVNSDRITVTDTPWGRGLPKTGNGKVNLSDKGREVTVLVQSTRVPYCKWVFKY